MTYEPNWSKADAEHLTDSQLLMEQRLEAVFQGAIKLRDRVDALEDWVRALWIINMLLLVALVIIVGLTR